MKRNFPQVYRLYDLYSVTNYGVILRVALVALRRGWGYGEATGYGLQATSYALRKVVDMCEVMSSGLHYCMRLRGFCK